MPYAGRKIRIYPLTDIFDSHFHIIDRRYPLYENSGFVPGQFTTEDYLSAVKDLGIAVCGGVVIAGSYHGYRNDHLVDSLKRLGEKFFGIAQLYPDTDNNELMHLDSNRVRGVRINIRRGTGFGLDEYERFAKKVYDMFGWHVELYVDSVSPGELFRFITRLPSVSIDHLGLSKSGFNDLLKLVEKGVKVKATGFGRLNFDAVEAMRRITEVNPDSLMFGTDLPSTRAEFPFRKEHLDLVRESFNQIESEKILSQNALSFYTKSAGNY